jgi:uncharacterized LabA/DUF88 family protein
VSRVAVYVDGFNLYYALKRTHGRRYLWLDLQTLARRLLKPDQRLEAVRYLTAHVRNDPAAHQRQQIYLDALRTHTDVDIVLGRYQAKHMTCWECSARWVSYEEKETDVSIAVSLVEDGVSDRFDTALLLSADGDLCPGVRALKRMRPGARVVAVFPPGRLSPHMQTACDASFTLGAAHIRNSLLPDVVDDPVNGLSYKRPSRWH